MRETLLNALRALYEGEALKAKANIEVYLLNPAGIGEHPDIVEAMDLEISKLAEADEKLETLNKYFPL